jgi:hypothetical protein
VVSVDAHFKEELDDGSVLGVEEGDQLLVSRSLLGVTLDIWRGNVSVSVDGSHYTHSCEIVP